MLDEARASLAALSAERAASGEVANAAAVIHLAEGTRPRRSASSARSSMVTLRSSMTSLSWSPICSPRGRTVSYAISARQMPQLSAHSELAERDRLIFPFVMTGQRTCWTLCLATRQRTRRCLPTFSMWCRVRLLR